MKRVLLICLWTVLAAGIASADEVPKTTEGGAAKIKEGGKDIGEGFKGIGRGVRDVFTGESSKEDFREGKKIGTGVVDVGKGVGGVGRGTGHDVKEGFEGDGSAKEPARTELEEEKLEK